MLRHVLLAIALGLLLAACGGGDDDSSSGQETFDENGFAITFEYPDDFDEVEDIDVASTAGGAAKERAGVGLDEHNLIIVTRFDLTANVTSANLEKIKKELDDVVSQAAGQELSGKRIEYGGLPGYEYEFDITEPVEGHSRFIAVFDGEREYTINCQHTQELRDEVRAACTTALDTLERRG